MNNDITILAISAISIGFFHTLLGPDHYLPFIFMSKARKWNLLRTSVITILCGLGHIGSSIILGIAGIALGLAVSKFSFLESFRGNLAAWIMIGFGAAYMIWGIRQAYRNKTHEHIHHHNDGEVHKHNHYHDKKHTHIHDQNKKKNITPWILFTIFIFGPCEPLIPILMYPAAQKSMFGLILVTVIFGLTTIITMLSAVLVGKMGINFIKLGKFERYTHSIAGFTILLCGLSIQFLGL